MGGASSRGTSFWGWPAGECVMRKCENVAFLSRVSPTAPPAVRIVHSGQGCNVEEERYSERVFTIREGGTLELQCLVTGHPRPQVHKNLHACTHVHSLSRSLARPPFLSPSLSQSSLAAGHSGLCSLLLWSGSLDKDGGRSLGSAGQ